jgi:hypothetical protein
MRFYEWLKYDNELAIVPFAQLPAPLRKRVVNFENDLQKAQRTEDQFGAGAVTVLLAELEHDLYRASSYMADEDEELYVGDEPLDDLLFDLPGTISFLDSTNISSFESNAL